MEINNKQIEKLKEFIDFYSKIDYKVRTIKKNIEKEKEEIEKYISMLQEKKKEEEQFLNELREEYGNFSLNDLNDILDKEERKKKENRKIN